MNISLLDSNILDLFSGVGTFGIEYLSREASSVTFLENYKGVLPILKKNIDSLKLRNHSKIIEKNIFEKKTLELINEKFEIIFMDPPYKEKKLTELLNRIIQLKLLKKDGHIIIHRHKKNEDIFPDRFNIILKKNYGISKIIFGSVN